MPRTQKPSRFSPDRASRASGRPHGSVSNATASNPAGTIRLERLDAQEREALSLLLARPITGLTATIRLPDPDTRLRASAVGRGLASTPEELGPPPTDGRAVRDAAAAERARAWSTAQAELEATSLSAQPWTAQWLEEIRRGGTLARQDAHTATTVITQAVRILAMLFPGTDPRLTPASWGRGELAHPRHRLGPRHPAVPAGTARHRAGARGRAPRGTAVG
ncbi:TIGR02679 domain-containing protein [Streptomyces sp. NPDC060000]|uniref:TIGR02679 domain-containing protein n=1 Tax=Streptomyces sp. NPDC060000 TaxID=3347031 RepID=UPI0036BB1ED5